MNMDLSKIIELETIYLKDLNEINEKYIQEYIANDPSVLGLGELILKDKERIQPNAGRLDLLLYDAENNRRYEVELQLGKTDESHIIRTIEYWDIERKRYPQYEHCAVIIAEDITSRFLNVIQLFNGHIPLIAIKMSAYKIEKKYAIKFTKIVDELKLAIDEDEDDITPTDRNYWENRSTKEVMTLVDDVESIIQEFESSISVKYNKYYIGLTKSGRSFNFADMEAKKKFIHLKFKLEKNDEVDKLIDDSGLDVMEYNIRSNRYKIRLNKIDVQNKRELIKELLEKSYKNFR
jgi:predicted transport protein